MNSQHWLLDTGGACAGIVSVEGVVVETAPIFRRFMGLRIENLKRIYKVQPVFSPEIENQKQNLKNLSPHSPVGERSKKGEG